MSFFDKINNYLIVNAIEEILKGLETTGYRCNTVHRIGGRKLL